MKITWVVGRVAQVGEEFRIGPFVGVCTESTVFCTTMEINQIYLDKFQVFLDKAILDGLAYIS